MAPALRRAGQRVSAPLDPRQRHARRHLAHLGLPSPRLRRRDHQVQRPARRQGPAGQRHVHAVLASSRKGAIPARGHAAPHRPRRFRPLLGPLAGLAGEVRSGNANRRAEVPGGRSTPGNRRLQRPGGVAKHVERPPAGRMVLGHAFRPRLERDGRQEQAAQRRPAPNMGYRVAWPCGRARQASMGHYRGTSRRRLPRVVQLRELRRSQFSCRCPYYPKRSPFGTATAKSLVRSCVATRNR